MKKKKNNINWKYIKFPIIKILGKLDEEKYTNKKRETILKDVLNDKEIDYKNLEEMKKDFIISPKTIGEDLISVTPSVPEGYKSRKEPIVDYLKVNNLSELKGYLLNWFKEHSKIPKEWLQVTRISSMNLIRDEKSVTFISIFVDSPSDDIWQDIRINHREIGKLPLSYNIEEIKKLINEINVNK